MSETTPSRREFLRSSGSMLGKTWIALNLPAIQACARYARRAARIGGAFDVLTLHEAADLDAITAQIVPTDDTPGAREVGTVHFIDRALVSFASDLLDPLRGGLADLHSMVRHHYPGVEAFSELSFDQQMEALTEVEETECFEAVRKLTVMAMFANPSYGGNRDKIGWRLLGFEDRPSFQPPFGYYDREYNDGSREG